VLIEANSQYLFCYITIQNTQLIQNSKFQHHEVIINDCYITENGILHSALPAYSNP